MAGFSFTGQKLDKTLVASIACLLDSANVPNLLWDKYLLTIYGVPTIVDGVSFIVPDNLEATAVSALLNAGFLPFAHGSNCEHLDARWRPAPAAHVHINDELAVLLYRKSEALWTFPNIELLSPGAKDSNVMLASDSRLPPARLGFGRGRFSSSLYPVLIPTALRYCEALILLLCRDHGSAHETYWMAMLTYVLEFIDETDIFHEDDLGQCYKGFYHALKHVDSKVWSILDELRQDLIRRGILPAMRE